MQKIAFILHGKYDKAKKLEKEIYSTGKGRELQTEILLTGHTGHAEELAKTCTEAGFDRIIACGGDGTLSEVVNGIMNASKSEKPLFGLFPIGSGNDFSRIIPKRILTDFFQADIQTTVLDLCKITYENRVRHSINMVAGGLGSEVAITVNKRKFTMPVSLNYYLGIVQWLIKYKSPKLRVTIDEQVIEQNCFLTAIGKGNYAGNGMGLLPQASLQDGQLSICLIGNVTVVDFVRYLGNLKAARKINDPRVSYYKGKKVAIEVLNGSLAVDTEGEFFARVEAGQSIEFSILPKSLQVI